MTTQPLTTRHLDAFGYDSTLNLARFIFNRAHRLLPQYDGFLDGKENVRLIRVVVDPAEGLSTFSRYEPGDVLLAWDEWFQHPYGYVANTVAYCPRVRWNVGMIRAAYDEIPDEDVAA